MKLIFWTKGRAGEMDELVEDVHRIQVEVDNSRFEILPTPEGLKIRERSGSRGLFISPVSANQFEVIAVPFGCSHEGSERKRT